jgi:hypothetical protein
MKEWDAPESNKTEAGVELTRNIDADMATMLMSMCSAWIGEDGVQKGFQSQE